ncbi:MAG: substrate-binding domain-containing protein [Ornithinimicrobium sp.]
MLVPLGAGCAGQDSVTILAAASLSDVLPQLIALAEDEGDASLDYEISYAGSAQLVQQANGGAQPDILVLAGEGPLSALDADLGLSEPTIIATNSLALVTAPGNPADISALTDLASPSITLVLCAVQVPCGAAAAQMFAQADLDPEVASLEPDVRATLAKVSSGEADAGVVYVTDAATAGLPTVQIPPSADVVNSYPLLYDSDSEDGRRFLDLALSPAGQQVLAEAGFGIP